MSPDEVVRQVCEFDAAYDAVVAKWEALEDQLRAEYKATGWWRLWRKTKLDARLRGINIGLLQGTIRHIEERAALVAAHQQENNQ